mmetsp:Transcript_39190/g.101367  ORF Transcript_39190/g.101367 Transcript_39190/m.101367 type:complete len:376 (-) Transcript_39190:441-1568(-)
MLQERQASLLAGLADLGGLAEAPQGGLVNGLGPVGGPEEEDALIAGAEAIHPGQQRVGGGAVVLRHLAAVAAAQQRVHLVQEDDGGRVLLHELLQGLDALLRLAIELGHDVARAHVEERGGVAQLRRSRAGQHRLAAAGWAVQQQAAGVAPHAGEQRRVCNSRPHDGLLERGLRGLQADDILELDAPPEALHVHERGLELCLQLGKAVRLVVLLAVCRAGGLAHLLLRAAGAPAEVRLLVSAAGVAANDCLGPQLPQLCLKPRGQVALLIELRLQRRLVRSERCGFAMSAIQRHGICRRHGSRCCRLPVAGNNGGDHARRARHVHRDVWSRLVERHPHAASVAMVRQHQLYALHLGREADLAAQARGLREREGRL